VRFNSGVNGLLQPFVSSILCIGIIIDSFHSSGTSSLLQTEVIHLWNSERIVLYPDLINYVGVTTITADLWLFNFSIANSTSKALGSGSSGSAVCISVCVTSLTPSVHSLRRIVPPPSQNTVGVCNQTTLIILYYTSSRLVTLLKVIDASIKVPTIVYITVSFQLLNFSS
jgi:hypothetical protein